MITIYYSLPKHFESEELKENLQSVIEMHGIKSVITFDNTSIIDYPSLVNSFNDGIYIEENEGLEHIISELDSIVENEKVEQFFDR